MAGFAATLFKQAYPFDTHATVYCLKHVVNGQQADAGSGECFHFDSGATKTFSGYFAVDRAVFAIRRYFGA